MSPVSLSFPKPFNCSHFLSASIHWFPQSYCEATNATTMPRSLLLYQFWLAKICICHKPSPTRDEMRDLQIALLLTLILPFSSILPALHTQDTFMLVLNFEVGHFTCHFFLLSFLPSFWCDYERNSIHTASLSHFISLIRPAVFYPAGDGCWIHVNVGCSASIYSTPLVVFLNDKLQLAHRR